MDIPEIRFHIVHYLHANQLKACVRVSKAWNDLFTPHLYNEVNEENSKSSSLERYCTHIRKLDLELNNPVLKSLLEWPVTGIQELKLKGSWSYDSSIPPVLESLLQKNPRIVKLITRQIKGPPLVTMVSHCPNLRDLDIDDFEFRCYPPTPVDENGATPFWQMCQGLTRLTLSFNTLVSLPDTLLQPPSRGLPNMRHLIIGSSGASVVDQLRLILACKNVENLDWSLMLTESGDVGLDLDLIRNVFQCLGRLRKLKFVMPMIRPYTRENWTVQFIKILPALTGLNDVKPQLRDNTVGLVAGPLSRHFATLTDLRIGGWRGVSIEDNHLILTSCPGLQIFKSTHYAIGEIASLESVSLASFDRRSRSGLGPLGWVCTKLSLLEIKFAHDTPEKSRLMFEQLCFMRELETLELAGDKPGLIPKHIQWDDEASARNWPTCTTYSYDVGKKEDLHWMGDMWPKLFKFCTWYDRMVKNLEAE